jgi:hypothetical protein
MIIIGITASHASQSKSAADAPVVSTTNVNAYANTITWTQPTSTGTILDYKIETSTDNLNWTVLSTTNTTRTYSHNPLSANTRYYYRVAARTASGYGSYGVANQLTRVAALRTRLLTSNYSSSSTTGTTAIPLGINNMEAVVVGGGGWANYAGGGGGGVIYAASFPVPAGGSISYSIGWQPNYGGNGVGSSLTSVVSGITYQMIGNGGTAGGGSGGGASGSTSKSGSFVTQSWGSRPGGGDSGFATGGGGGATSNGTAASGYTAGNGGAAVLVAGQYFGGGGGGWSESGPEGDGGGGYGNGGTGFASGGEVGGGGAVWLRWYD